MRTCVLAYLPKHRDSPLILGTAHHLLKYHALVPVRLSTSLRSLDLHRCNQIRLLESRRSSLASCGARSVEEDRQAKKSKTTSRLLRHQSNSLIPHVSLDTGEHQRSSLRSECRWALFSDHRGRFGFHVCIGRRSLGSEPKREGKGECQGGFVSTRHEAFFGALLLLWEARAILGKGEQGACWAGILREFHSESSRHKGPAER